MSATDLPSVSSATSATATTSATGSATSAEPRSRRNSSRRVSDMRNLMQRQPSTGFANPSGEDFPRLRPPSRQVRKHKSRGSADLMAELAEGFVRNVS